MKTPKEKAEELVSVYFLLVQTIAQQKQCALIAVDEIQKLPNINYSNNKDASQYDYWQEVKTEIEKL
jgi:hypothetical protein